MEETGLPFKVKLQDMQTSCNLLATKDYSSSKDFERLVIHKRRISLTFVDTVIKRVLRRLSPGMVTTPGTAANCESRRTGIQPGLIACNVNRTMHRSVSFMHTSTRA